MTTLFASIAAIAVIVALFAIVRMLRAGAQIAASKVRASDALASAEKRDALLRTVVEATPVALVMFADTGTITFTNATARDLFFDAAVVDGENFLSMIDRAPESLRRALLGGGDELITVEIEGSPETFHLSKRHLGDGQTLVTVRPMTLEISRREIATLKKVIAIIGHEVNNSLAPISSILGSARAALQRPDMLPRLDGMLQIVQERAAHLQEFLGAYAKVARIPPPRPAPVPWEPFLDSIRALWPDVRIDPPPQTPGFFDAAQLQQVLINLIKNAREAGGNPGEVSVKIERPDEGGIRISVLDRGAGMSDEAFKNALLPFFTTKPTGTGLGLALCREIVELHRGWLRFARRQGGGMAVSLWVPNEGEAPPTTRAKVQARLSLTRT